MFKFKFKKHIDVILFSLITCGLIIFFLHSKANECKQYTCDLQCLLRDARDSQVRLIAFLNTLKKQKYPNATIIDPGIKQMPTIKRLLKMRYNNDVASITDYARATIGVDNLFQVYRCLDDIKASGLKIMLIKDHFLNPYPEKYRDINLVYKDSVNNHLCEIQINISSMLKFSKHEGYELFDKRRKIESKAYQEKRILLADEKTEIEELMAKEKNGNIKVFGESMKVNNKALRIGVYGILINENKVCMVQERVGSELIYNFPGGKVESNEGLAEALMRECKEEISVDVLVKDQLYASKNLYRSALFPKTYTFGLYYIIEANKNLVKNGTWFPIDKLPIDKMLPIDKEIASFLSQKNQLV